ncbi:MAG: glycosyltransferase [Calditrichae bacterium]|nr:glycosyltransferase [Calditrichia bacterium]
MNKPAPELTICLTSHRDDRALKGAIESILHQQQVRFELLLVSDDLRPKFRRLIDSFDDSRLRLINVSAGAGIAYGRNIAIKHSDAALLAFTTSDWLLLPDALQRMARAINNDPAAGLVGCHYFDIAPGAPIRREHFRNSVGFPANAPEISPGDAAGLLRNGSLRQHFFMVRKSVFEIAGQFDESIQRGSELEFSLRLLGDFEIRVVPEPLCFTQGLNRSKDRFFHRLRAFIARNDILSRLSAHSKAAQSTVTFPNRHHLRRSLASQFVNLAQVKHAIRIFLGFPRRNFHRIRNHLKQVVAPYCYRFAITYLSKWLIGLPKIKPSGTSPKDAAIAYYTWNFPAFSQTFIQREVTALAGAGIPLTVFADTCKNPEALDEQARYWYERTQYLMPLDQQRVLKYRRMFLRAHPLRYLNLFMFVMTRSYAHYKSFQNDRFIFAKAVYLAGLLQDRHITHLHAPWADISAFIVMVAARLLGITYSLQGRAHELHRKQFAFALDEKFSHALFAVTNTQFNRRHLASILNGRTVQKLHQIYNGVDLARFRPGEKTRNAGGPVRILSVARLIEEKGLVYLLQACAQLRDRGIAFQCDIIGGPEEPYYLNYHLQLKKLYRCLRLREQVSFLGPLSFDRILTHYQSADIFVLPCVIAENGGRDIIPNSLIEAMAMRLPVIATPVGGIPEMVEEGISGLIVPPGDAAALADAIRKLIDDPQLSAELGRNARKRVEERFDINRNIASYIALFKAALDPGS